MKQEIVESAGAKIAFSSQNVKTPGALRLLALACGNSSFLAKVSQPVAELTLRGFGASKVSENSMRRASSLSSYNADVDAVLSETESGKNVALLGYSHGGYFATAYTLANPDKINSLVLMEPALFTPRAELLKRASIAEGGDVNESIDLMLNYVAPSATSVRLRQEQTLITKAVQSGTTLAAEYLLRAKSPLTMTQLKTIKQPTLLIGATESAHRSTVERLAKILPNASVWWVRGADHLSLIEERNADEIGSVIETFLRTIK